MTQIFIRDTGSAHGTYVNGERLLAKGGPFEIETGDIIVSSTPVGSGELSLTLL